ncbi:hypothetical protein ABIC16_003244 [Sphingomonas sp. PvP055]|uniref:hypothetical protein n=1 Tax=Sphingomonas sp. PvP055 TaxID=3156391 RepID=UPI003394D604
MAYFDINHPFAAPVPARSQTASAALPTEPTTAARAGFSALEWSVIALAQRDTLGSLNTPGRMSRALGTVFGRGTASRLADPKLEALRRAAVYARHRGYAMPVTEIGNFHENGFSEAQMETLVTSITGLRIGKPARSTSA